MTEIKKGRLGTSRTTALLKQKGNNAFFISALGIIQSRLNFFRDSSEPIGRSES